LLLILFLVGCFGEIFDTLEGNIEIKEVEEVAQPEKIEEPVPSEVQMPTQIMEEKPLAEPEIIKVEPITIPLCEKGRFSKETPVDCAKLTPNGFWEETGRKDPDICWNEEEKPKCSDFGFEHGGVGALCEGSSNIYNLEKCYKNKKETCSEEDGGKGYSKFSTTKQITTAVYGHNCKDFGGIKNIDVIEKVDSCLKNNVTEYYCKEDKSIGSILGGCDNGCKDGACKKGNKACEAFKLSFKNLTTDFTRIWMILVIAVPVIGVIIYLKKKNE
jgi:hypothetical protein